jgi:hypothetical protein
MLWYNREWILGGVSERFNVGVLKTPGRKPRGFESLPLRLFWVVWT